MVNNAFYLLEQFSKNSSAQLSSIDNDEMYYLENAVWFKDKVGGAFQSQKDLYLSHWDILRVRLTSVEKSDLVYQKDKLLSLESGRLIKSRFSTFNEDFEELYQIHRPLKVIDNKLRISLQRDVSNMFLPHYTEFFEKYAKIQFSKKNQESYLKYPPMRVQSLIDDLYEIL
jgi:exocyst complex protein 7